MCLTLRHASKVLNLESGRVVGAPALPLSTISKMLLFFLLLQAPFPKSVTCGPKYCNIESSFED